MRQCTHITRVNYYIINCALAFLAYVLIYGYAVLRLGLGGDEMWDLSEPCWQLYIAQGRWLTPLYRLITATHQMVPFAYGVAAGIFYSMAVALHIRILGIRAWKSQILFIVLSLGILQINQLMSVSWMQDSVCLGILLISYSYYLFKIWNRRLTLTRALIVIGIAVLGISSYQTNALIFVALLGGDFVYSSHSWRKLRLHRGVLMLFVSIVTFYLIKYLLIRIMLHLDHDSIYCVSLIRYYHESLTTWCLDEWEANSLASLKALSRLLTGMDSKDCWLYGVTILPLIFLTISQPRRRIIAVVAAALYCLPFVPALYMGKGIESQACFTRLYSAEPLVASILWCGALKLAPKWFDWLTLKRLCLLSLLLIIEGSYIASERAFTEKRTYDFSVRMASEIRAYARAYTPVPCGVDPNSLPIVVVGGIPFSGGNTRFNKTGTRFFGGYLFQSHSFDDMRFIACPDPHAQGLDPLIKRVVTLPSYPLNGCSIYIEGKIYVCCPVLGLQW